MSARRTHPRSLGAITIDDKLTCAAVIAAVANYVELSTLAQGNPHCGRLQMDASLAAEDVRVITSFAVGGVEKWGETIDQALEIERLKAQVAELEGKLATLTRKLAFVAGFLSDLLPKKASRGEP